MKSTCLLIFHESKITLLKVRSNFYVKALSHLGSVYLDSDSSPESIFLASPA